MRRIELTRGWLKEFAQCHSGVAFIEFALTIPLLLLMLFGAVEITHYVLLIQKLEKTDFTVADVSSQYNVTNNDPLTSTEFQNMMVAMDNLMNPYGFANNGFIVVTDVIGTVDPSNSSNPPIPTIQWQQCSSTNPIGAHSKLTALSGASVLSTPADLSAISGGFTIDLNEEIVVAEIFYLYTPIVAQDIVPLNTIYRNVVASPRLGNPVLAADAAAGLFTCP